MSDHAAIGAQVVDIQNDRMHKGFIKVTIHVPAECGQQLTAAMGWPTYTTPVPVAIARLNPETEVMPAESKHHTIDTPPASGPDIPARARKPVDPDKRLAQRAGILSTDLMFHHYLRKKVGFFFSPDRRDSESAAEYIRAFCNVDSRAEIKPNTEAALRLDLIESAYVAWRDVPEFADAS